MYIRHYFFLPLTVVSVLCMEFLLINRCSVCILVAGQIGPKSNHPQIKSLYYYVVLFNLIICIVNCVVYLIPNQIIVLLCCLFNLIICP